MDEDILSSALSDLRGLDLASLPSISTPLNTALDRILATGTGECNNYFNQFIG